jgi:hypothetical protein
MSRSRILPAPLVFLVAGLFVIVNPERTSSQSCCIIPTSYPTTYGGVPENPNDSSKSKFYETLSTPNSVVGREIEESTGLGTPNNGCYFTGSQVPQNPSLSGGSWNVGTFSLDTGATNPAPSDVWGYDYIGFNAQAVIGIMQAQAAGKLTMPCTITIPQDVAIMCDDSTLSVYESDTISTTIAVVNEATHSYQITNCRGTPKVCGPPIPASF